MSKYFQIVVTFCGEISKIPNLTEVFFDSLFILRKSIFSQPIKITDFLTNQMVDFLTNQKASYLKLGGRWSTYSALECKLPKEMCEEFNQSQSSL